MRWLLLAMLMATWAFSPNADAAPGSDVEHWQGVHRRATGRAKAGAYIGAVGLGLDLMGVVLLPFCPERDEEVSCVADPLLGTGTTLEVLGAPLMAGGSLRARRALLELGADVPNGNGKTAWYLWGAYFGLRSIGGAFNSIYRNRGAAFPRVIAIAAYSGSVGALLGSYLSSALQLRRNAAVRDRMGVIARDRRPWQVGIGPSASFDELGVRVVATF
ncbi:MAG: hypothetical protein JRI25_13000 [Deltaproteobacteria bacterium]|nr:hypothetical protein [Deltaproteobacteria bacterium]MBW2255501.1 hypothetical protein [Deltaproteobacteria bacterium]